MLHVSAVKAISTPEVHKSTARQGYGPDQPTLHVIWILKPHLRESPLLVIFSVAHEYNMPVVDGDAACHEPHTIVPPLTLTPLASHWVFVVVEI